MQLDSAVRAHFESYSTGASGSEMASSDQRLGAAEDRGFEVGLTQEELTKYAADLVKDLKEQASLE